MKAENDIFLRPPEQSDAALLYEWENNDEYSQFSSLQEDYTLEEIKSFINTVKDIKANKQFRFMICLRESNAAIGTVDLYEIDFAKKKAGLGILIADKIHRRKGYAFKAIELTEKFAREKLSLNTLFCEITTSNQKSVDLFEKVGFSAISLRKNAHIIDSVAVDVYFYEKKIQ